MQPPRQSPKDYVYSISTPPPTRGGYSLIRLQKKSVFFLKINFKKR